MALMPLSQVLVRPRPPLLPRRRGRLQLAPLLWCLVLVLALVLALVVVPGWVLVCSLALVAPCWPPLL